MIFVKVHFSMSLWKQAFSWVLKKKEIVGKKVFGQLNQSLEQICPLTDLISSLVGRAEPKWMFFRLICCRGKDKKEDEKKQKR